MLLLRKIWFSIVLPIVVMIDSAILLPSTIERVATYCHQEETDKRCFHLYNKRDLTSWLTAYELCLEFGQRLATVPDLKTQAVMERFSAVTLSGPGQPHAWIAGRRTEDNTWRTLDEIIFSGPVSDDMYRNSSCVVYHPLNKTFYMHTCRQDTPYLNMFVCQYSSSRGCLDASALLLPPICYKVLAPTLTSPVRTWNGANQQCQDSYPEGTLAYSYIYPETEVTDYISQTMLQSGHSNVSVWIGIRRHPWVWVTESSDGEIVEIPFTYTNWWNQEGASVDERCAHLDLRQKSAWADKDCSVLSQYFVCEEEGNVAAYVTTASQTEDFDQQLTTKTYQDVTFTGETNTSNHGSITNSTTNVTANKHDSQDVLTKQEDSVVTTTPTTASVTSTTTITSTPAIGPITTTSHTNNSRTITPYMKHNKTTTTTTTEATSTPVTTELTTTTIFRSTTTRTLITATLTRSTITTTITTAYSLAPYTTAATNQPNRSPPTKTNNGNDDIVPSAGTTIGTTRRLITTLPSDQSSISIVSSTSSLVHQHINTEVNRFDREINLTTTPSITNNRSATPGTVTKSTEDITKTASLITTENIELTFIISVVIICVAVIMLVIGANIWDAKRSKRKKTKDVYFGSEENSSGESNFNAAFSIENGIENVDKSTISHINIGRINTMALKGNSMLLRDHETASLAINPAYSSCSEQDPEENFKCPDVVSRGLNVGCKKEDETRVSGSTSSNSLIQSIHYSDISYGGHLEFKDASTPKPIYD